MNLLNRSKIAQFENELIELYGRGVQTIRDFVATVERLAEEKYPNAKIDPQELDRQNTFKGDMLEIMAEIFFALFQTDTAVGVRNYTPVPPSEDFGVDAFGTNVNGNQCVVQVKYRNNISDTITYKDMARTYASARERHNISLDENDTMLLFTTAGDISPQCSEVFGNKIRVIDRKIIAGKIDDNKSFWIEAGNLIDDTLNDMSKMNAQ
jgi:hypothetical protein